MTDPRNNDLQHERELEAYLAGRHALSVRYLDASRETAPPELDAAILAAARAAVAHPPRRRSRWRVPLALAATMVLGVSLVSQLRDDAVPEAVRSGGGAPVLRQAPTTPRAPAARESQTLPMESVADMVAPAEPVPAPAPADRAKPAAAAPPPQDEFDGPRRQEQEAGAAMKQRQQQAAERRERAQADGFAAAPQARAFAPAPAPASATLDQVSIAARELLGLLRAGDAEALAARVPAPSRAAVVAALSALADAHAAQVFAENDEGWPVVYRDAQGRRLGVAVLGFSGADWRLLRLEADAPDEGVE